MLAPLRNQVLDGHGHGYTLWNTPALSRGSPPRRMSPPRSPYPARDAVSAQPLRLTPYCMTNGFAYTDALQHFILIGGFLKIIHALDSSRAEPPELHSPKSLNRSAKAQSCDLAIHNRQTVRLGGARVRVSV